MQIRKLDRRFRLYKQGLATHYTDIDPKEYFGDNGIEAKLTASFGPGQSMPKWRQFSHCDRKYDWFYVCKDTWVEEQTQISTSLDGRPVYSVRKFKDYIYRVYFRREDQATLLALIA